jgi:hypothetical protein
LDRILGQGGDFVKRGADRLFCTPYTYARYPTARQMDDLNEMTEGDPWAVMGKNVVVHASPRRDSAVVGTLSYEWVDLQHQSRPDEAGESRVWQWVFLPNGKNGYIDDRYVWNRSHNFHMCFGASGERWQIVELKEGL